MTHTDYNLKQIMTLITFKNDIGDDSSVANTQIGERHHWRYFMTIDIRKNFGVYVYVVDDVMAW